MTRTRTAAYVTELGRPTGSASAATWSDEGIDATAARPMGALNLHDVSLVGFVVVP
jgi:hypothetical protein